MNGIIKKLDINNYYKCNNIWDMSKKKYLVDKFYNELKNGNRITFIYELDDEYVGVDLDNYVALLVYYKYGFDRIIKVDEDAKYLKLLKKL